MSRRAGDELADVWNPKRVGSAGRVGYRCEIRVVGLDEQEAIERADGSGCGLRTSGAPLNVTMPENESVAPMSRARRASSGPPVKQCKTVRSGTPASARTANVSSHVSCEWITKREAVIVRELDLLGEDAACWTCAWVEWS